MKIEKVLELIGKIDSNPFLNLSTIRRLYDEKKLPVLYVLNNIDMGGRRARGIITLPVTDSNSGEQRPVTIPLTYAPFDLSSVIDVGSIVNSQYFASLVNTQKVLVFKPGVAEQLLEVNSIIRDEAIRVANGEDSNSFIPGQNKENTTNITAAVIAIIGDDGINDREKVSRLRVISEQITEEDYKYILANSTSDVLRRFSSEGLEGVETPVI